VQWECEFDEGILVHYSKLQMHLSILEMPCTGVEQRPCDFIMRYGKEKLYAMLMSLACNRTYVNITSFPSVILKYIWEIRFKIKMIC
jgi:hypothetical protein